MCTVVGQYRMFGLSKKKFKQHVVAADEDGGFCLAKIVSSQGNVFGVSLTVSAMEKQEGDSFRFAGEVAFDEVRSQMPIFDGKRTWPMTLDAIRDEDSTLVESQHFGDLYDTASSYSFVGEYNFKTKVGWINVF